MWKWPVVKYKHIKIKPRICVLFILRLTWTVNANSLKQNIIVTKQMCSWLPLSCKQNLVLFILPRWQLDYDVHPGRAWSSSPCTWHCSLHYLISPGNSLNKARDDRGLGWQWNHASFFALTVSISSLFVPALLRTHSFSVFFSVHETLRMCTFCVLARQRHCAKSQIWYDTIRYDTRCYFDVRSKADMSQLNLPHGNDN